VRLRLDAFGCIELKLRASLAKFRSELRGCEDWYIEDLARFEELLGCADNFLELMNRRSELLLEVANAALLSGEIHTKGVRKRDRTKVLDELRISH
jgi:hypothetical protein